MSKQTLVMQEEFGMVTPAQLLVYRKYKVTPAEHQLLCVEFGEDNHDTITLVVRARSMAGRYSQPFPGGMH